MRSERTIDTKVFIFSASVELSNECGAPVEHSLIPASCSLLFQALLDPSRVLARIQNGVNRDKIGCYCVINGIGEALRQHPVKILRLLPMDTRIKSQRINVGVEGIQKILADAARLRLVERKSIHKIQLGAVENPNSHETRSWICFFAVSQSVNPTSPDSARRNRSSRMRSCQSGGEYPSSALDRSDQISSMIKIFSGTVISFSGNVTFIVKILADFLLASRRRMSRA